jgi:hypothetical protein
LFFAGIPYWEREEIASVFEFLANYTRDLIENVEDEFVKASKEEALRHPRPDVNASNHDWTQFDSMDLLGLNMFEKSRMKSQFENLIFTVLGFGLPCLRALNHISPSARLDFLNSYYCNPSDKHNLGMVLRMSNHYEYEGARNDKSQPNGSFEDSLKGCNMGWQWVRASNSANRRVYLPDESALRNAGYVFWDCDRLKESGLLDLQPESIRRYDAELSHHKPRASVQERLAGIWVLDEWLEETHGDDIDTGYDMSDLEVAEY